MVLPWRKALPVEGAGCIRKIPDLLRENGAAKPMVVTDPGLAKAGISSRITELLEGEGIAFVLYSEVESNPSIETVNKIYALHASEACDSFIALGGGSVMDAVKAAAARTVRPRLKVNQMGGLFRILKKLPLIIAVPTTAGTGSETTIAALITDTETRHKYAIMDLCLIPRYAVLDAELTVALPPAMTAATGMDALTHAVEAYLCWTYGTRESIGFAMDAVKAIFENLPRVYKNGADIEARQAMLAASYKAGFAFTRAGVGNIHSIAHTLGGLYNTPHGLANAVILPVVLEDYGKKVWKKLGRLADLSGAAPASASTNEEKAKAFIKAIYDMNAEMGIPRGFNFIKSDDIKQICKWAYRECNPLYPVPVVYNRARFRKLVEHISLEAEHMSYTIGEGCTGCTACARLCPVFAISPPPESNERGKRHEINSLRCVECGVCGRICPGKAISDSSGNICSPVKRSQWPKPKIKSEGKHSCSACGICVQNCKPRALSISLPRFRGDIGVHAELSAPEKCIACRLCEKHCPLGAVVMVMPAEEASK